MLSVLHFLFLLSRSLVTFRRLPFFCDELLVSSFLYRPFFFVGRLALCKISCSML